MPIHSIYAQEEHPFCSKRDAFDHPAQLSPNLDNQQYLESQKYDVTFYALDLEMSNLSTDIEGTGQIHGHAKENLDSILFELYSSLNISEIRLDNNIVSFNRELAVVKVPANLLQGDSFVLEIDYQGTPPNSSSTPFGGSGMSNESSPSWGNQITWSLSEPFSAYEWWPCKQDLRDKADSVSVNLTVPDSCKAGSNGVLENVIDLGNGKTRYEWFHRHPIAYYLISVAIGEYVEYKVYANPSNSNDSILIQNYIYDNPATLPMYKDEIDETADFLELFAELFGPYPFDDEKYSHCMAPLSGGMEHQTMTTQGFFNRNLTAHELGHQWWGNSVTCASWADIWINEGFASYSSYLVLENLYPSLSFSNMLNTHLNVMSEPGGSIWKVDSLDEAAIFNGRLTYDKGAAFVHTLRFMLDDDDLFYQTLQQFLSDFKDSTAIGIDFRNTLNNNSNLNFDQAFEEWYFGEGYPVYSLVFNNVGDDLLFKVSHTTSSSTPTFTNPLEIKFSRNGMPDTTLRVDINSNESYFTIEDFNGEALNAAIDPDNWIINDVGSIVKDENYLSTNKPSLKPKLDIFPNPFYEKLNVQIDNQSTCNIIIYNAQGREVIHKTFEQNTSIDMSNFNSGNYILKLLDENGNQWVKTLVKN